MPAQSLMGFLFRRTETTSIPENSLDDLDRHKNGKTLIMQKFEFFDVALLYRNTFRLVRSHSAHEGADIKLLPPSCLPVPLSY